MERSEDILNKLASAQGRRDEIPNQELAAEIVETNNTEAIAILVKNLNGKEKAVQNDCIKVLYEIGELQPTLISAYHEDFLHLLNHKNNRLQWGAMTALCCISRVKPGEIYEKLPQIIDAADAGSVITRDYAMNIMIELGSVPEYASQMFSLLTEQLLKSPPNQFPMYMERTAHLVNNDNKDKFISILETRIKDLEKESARKRVEKMIRKLMKM
ncbi:hypothetical protein GWK08_01120 [Leptobacterium flavescens]|uniref:HEAT repeat domain-containing protein n=1 Tax=Leptobacterium flavescens TaxID=472055 RepID=A0A6P0UJJ2_9FLAO|nr:hypothetical protein [Leptobacterium flavescens]NER12029.1 hypothetical protein [Leptobacterium flavescens]